MGQLADLARDLERATMTDVAVEALDRVADDMAADARRNFAARTTRRTGHLVDSVGVERRGDAVVVVADGAVAPYAAYVELGTRRQPPTYAIRDGVTGHLHEGVTAIADAGVDLLAGRRR